MYDTGTLAGRLSMLRYPGAVSSEHLIIEYIGQNCVTSDYTRLHTSMPLSVKLIRWTRRINITTFNII